VISNPLGAIFRAVNIIEYKSPGDYLSIGDYHKAGAYVRLYSVLNKREMREMTLSFVVERYPRKVMNYVKGRYGYEVEEGWPGIYHVKGGEEGGIQVVETKKLREEDGGIWLRDLRGGLKGEELRGIIERGRGMGEGAPMAAYIAMILQANEEGIKEIEEMSKVRLERVLERHGFITKWKEEGREEGLERGREEAVKRLQRHGMDPTEIAGALELPLAAVFKYLDAE
jgi:hypothetical protein